MANNSKKCDVIIPVYNAPEWVKLCVYAVMKNTDRELLNKVYLMNDNSNEKTYNCLCNLKRKYGDIIEVVTNDINLGFVKNCNKALKMTTADYTLLLNSDCLISKNTIGKLIKHLETDSKIGLICPLASNAANLSIEMFEGFSYTAMDALFEKKFLGLNFDACTVVGNCLMITRDCIEKVGYLDEIYGMGYGEETDYQFQAMKKGFKAKVAIDTYVFHKAEVSFGTSKAKQEKLEKNRKIFFDRWDQEYKKECEKYSKNDPVEYVLKNITKEDRHIKIDTVIYLPYIVQNAGGCHVVVDMINYLSIIGERANIVYNAISEYKETMLFQPISIEKIDEIECRQVVSTIWDSAFKARRLADKKNISLISFIQGYEAYFEAGTQYGAVELSLDIADHVLVISDYLKYKLKLLFDIESTIINNGCDFDVLYRPNTRKKIKTISFVLRGNVMKGDFILLDILKHLDKYYDNLEINCVYINQNIRFPNLEKSTNKINLIKGPLGREEMTNILSQTDLYVDASFSEGFGLMALEAIFCGAVPVVANSFGINEYMKDDINGYIIDAVNDADRYIEKIDYLLKNDLEFVRLKNYHEETCYRFDYDNMIEMIAKYLSGNKGPSQRKELLGDRKKIIAEVSGAESYQNSKKRFFYRISNKTPLFIKNKIKKIVDVLYHMYQH